MFDKLIDLIVSSIRIFQFWCVVPSYSRGVVLRFGKFRRMADPGLNWILPAYIEDVLETNTVPDTLLVGPQSLTTKDDVLVVVSVVITYFVEDVKKFLLDVEGGVQVLEDSACGILAAEIMTNTWTQLKTIDVANELTKAVRREAKRYGVGITRVQLKDFTRCRSYRLIQALGHGHAVHQI